MNQETQEGRKTYAARFVPCPNCGLHGEIVISGVPESADYPVPLPNQGEVYSQETAIMQAAVLLVDGYIDANGFRSLITQILKTYMSPTEDVIQEWWMHMLLLQASEGSSPLGALMSVFGSMPRASRPAPSQG